MNDNTPTAPRKGRNRLNLNFQIEGSAKRRDFVDYYLSTIDFTPNSQELETIANYVLWGDRKETAAAGIELPHHLNSAGPQIASLEALQESPAFNESSVRSLGAPALKVRKPNFDRELARRQAPPHIRAELETLWEAIDELVATLANPNSDLIPYQRLRLRRLLIEKRREQYTLFDFYKPGPKKIIPKTYSPTEDPDIGAEIAIYPPLRSSNGKFSKILYPANRFPIPADAAALCEADQRRLSRQIWEAKYETEDKKKFAIDLRNPDHLEQLFRAEIYDSEELPFGSAYAQLRPTIEYFFELTPLAPSELFVLRQKLAGHQNQPIAAEVNAKFSKTYNPNYISTIYKKTLRKIAATAQQYCAHLESLFIPENFKNCIDCGVSLLINERNFMRKKTSSDGFASVCKRCAAERRRFASAPLAQTKQKEKQNETR